MSLMSCDHVTIIPSHSLIGQPFCRSATHFWKNFTHFNESCYTFSLLQIELLWYLGLPEWRIFGIQNTQSHSEKFRLASLVWVYSNYVGINFVLPRSTYLEGFLCNDNLQYIIHDHHALTWGLASTSYHSILYKIAVSESHHRRLDIWAVFHWKIPQGMGFIAWLTHCPAKE